MTTTNSTLSNVQMRDPMIVLWESNNNLVKKIEQALAGYVEHHGCSPTDTHWKDILRRGFGIALNRLKAIQYLMSPQNDGVFSTEASSLARNLFEAWVTLAWIDIADEIERDMRIDQFQNDSIISQSKLIQPVNERIDSPPSPVEVLITNRAKEIRARIRNKSEKKFPNVSERIKEIQKRDRRFKDSSFYHTVFKDFSSYVHFSASSLTEISWALKNGELFVQATTDPGIRCLEVSGASVIFIAEIWNKAFKVINPDELEQWSTRWNEVLQGVRK